MTERGGGKKNDFREKYIPLTHSHLYCAQIKGDTNIYLHLKVGKINDVTERGGGKE